MANARQRQAAAGEVKSTKTRRKAAPMKRPSKLKKRTGAGVGGKKTARQVKVEKAWTADQMLPDEQEELFCRLMAEGRYSRTSCYAQSHPDASRDTARSHSVVYVAKHSIRQRIEWLRQESLKSWSCEKEEVMRFLHSVVLTPVGYVDEESPMAQEVNYDAETGAVVKVKTPGKKECAELLAKMQGWEKPQEVKLNVSYEPPSKALERASAKGVDLAGILRKAGVKL